MQLKYLLLLLFIPLNLLSQHKFNGINLTSSPDSLHYRDVIDIQKINANYVALIPFGFMRSLSSNKIIHNHRNQWFGESIDGIKQYICAFDGTSTKIMIKPQIWIHDGFTGHINMQSEADWKSLETTYSTYILSFARIAEKMDVDLFCVGNELEQWVIERPNYWKRLISEVRKIYHGKLTYAANWDECEKSTLWQDIDLIGINAYFPLTDKESPTIEEFNKGWEPIKKRLHKLSTSFNKPILFTEYGYRSIDYTGKEPWKFDHNTDVNLKAQSNALQALYDTFWSEQWFAGGFLWKWHTKHSTIEGKNDNQFTPQNKPAQKIIEQHYNKWSIIE